MPSHREAQLRHARHYLVRLKSLEQRYLRGGDEAQQSVGAFDECWPQIERGQQWAAAHRSADPEAQELAQAYPLGASDLLHLRQPPRQRIEWLEAASAAADSTGERLAKATAEGNLGNAYAELGETEKAVLRLHEAAELLLQAGDARGANVALANIGMTYRKAHDYGRAEEALTEALALFRRFGDRYGEASVIGNLANVYGDQGDVAKAARAYEQALEIFREIQNTRGVGMTLSNLARAYADLGETTKAVATYREALMVARQLGDSRTEAAALWNLSLIDYDKGEKPEAIEAASVALKIFLGLGAQEEAGIIRRRLAQWQHEGKISS
jgi:tetratricopeptide (TPR) repeat protein